MFFFFLFSPSNSLFRELIYKEMLPLYPRRGGGSTTVRRALFYDLSWSRQAVTGRSTQSSELHNHPPGVQHRAACFTITLLPEVPGDTGLENYGIKKQCLVRSIVFWVDLMWKENSIQQLGCPRAFSVRGHSWSFLWFNKNAFAFVYDKHIRKLKHLTWNGSWQARRYQL